MNILIVKGDVVMHPQNGPEERLVVATSELRGEQVMRVSTGSSRHTSLWITQRGWYPIRDYDHNR